MIVDQHLRRIAREHPDRPAFVSPGVSLSYREAADRVERIAQAMVARGCPPGTSVAILSPNHAHAFACMLGVLRAGAAWVPVNVRNGADANAAFLAANRCRWLFWHGSLAADVAFIRERVPTLTELVRIDGDADDPHSLAALLASGTDAPPLPDETGDPERICTIAATGGTTGTPKGVTWSDVTWTTLLDTTTAVMPCDVPPVHLCVAPMTHAAGVLAMMLMPRGPTNVVMDRADPLEIMRNIQAHRVTHLYLPPTVLYLMLSHPEVANFDYASLRYFHITAAPVAPEKLREAVQVFGPAMSTGYGQAEAPMLCTFLAPDEVAAAARDEGARAMASCGRITPFVELAIMAPDGTLLGPDESGEIVVKGDLVMRGYRDDPAATAEVSQHGWHHTGDIGLCDADGRVYVIDRKKDMIITGGFNVYPAEVERLLVSHPAVQECAVVGVPDDKWGEAVKAVVELKAGAAATEEELIAFCRGTLGGVKTPKTVEFRDSLPKSAVGKILKREIRDGYWKGRTRAI